MNVIRAWKDEDYYSSLNKEELRLLPENPAGIIELSDDQMEGFRGGRCKGKSSINISFDCIVDSNCALVCISNIGGSC